MVRDANELLINIYYIYFFKLKLVVLFSACYLQSSKALEDIENVKKLDLKKMDNKLFSSSVFAQLYAELLCECFTMISSFLVHLGVYQYILPKNVQTV